MFAFRALIRRYRLLAIAMLVATLWVKAMVPSGYMITPSIGKSLTIQICTDGLSPAVTRSVTVPMNDAVPNPANHEDGGRGAKAECAFTSLSMASLAGVDSAVLAAAVLFILMVGFASVCPRRASYSRHLRPPLRGPPALNLTA